MSDWIPQSAHAIDRRWLCFGFTYLLACGRPSRVCRRWRPKAAPNRSRLISPAHAAACSASLFALFVAIHRDARSRLDNDHASAAVSREASALTRGHAARPPACRPSSEARSGGVGAQLMSSLARFHGGMADDGPPRSASLRAAPALLAEALQAVVAMTPTGAGEHAAQREIITALGSALDARRPADHRQPGRGQSSEMVVSLLASDMRVDRDRARSLR